MKLKHMGLKKKLILSFLVLALVPLIITGLGINQFSTKAMDEAALLKLDATEKSRISSVKNYFKTIENQIQSSAQNPLMIEAMKGFKKTFNEVDQSSSDIPPDQYSRLQDFYRSEFGKKYEEDNGEKADINSLLTGLSPVAQLFQAAYISENPHPLGSKSDLLESGKFTSYDQQHARYHPFLKDYLERFEYYDIFLVDNQSGHIVYSVFKELDYASSLLTGPYRDTNFADAFRRARNLSSSQEFVIEDFKQYTPSFSAPASFIASPIYDGGTQIGVLIFQMPLDTISSIMNDRGGMGETGETYLVGKDGLMRSDSYRSPEKYSVVNVFREGLRYPQSILDSLTLYDRNYLQVTESYLGETVLRIAEPLDVFGLEWFFVAEMNESEALASTKELQWIMMLITLCSALIVGVFAWWLARNIANQVEEITDDINASSLSVNSYSADISSSATSLSESVSEQAASLQETVASVDEISAMTSRNADAAEKSKSMSEKTNSAARKGKETVAEMIEAIEEIKSSNHTTTEAMNHNNKQIAEIAQFISEIGEKTKLINDIVFQTKLLSFNASVEAARAGEHGKGFAVVAEEVGNLARMSGSAANEIGDMLENGIKKVTSIVEENKKNLEELIVSSKKTVEKGTSRAEECDQALSEIAKNVAEVNTMIQEIASASQEQSQGIQEINQAMNQLDEANQQNSKMVHQSESLSSNLRDQSQRLQRMVNQLGILLGRSIAPASKKAEQGTQETSGKKNNIVPMHQNKSEKSKTQSTPKSKPSDTSQSQKKIAVGQNMPLADDPRFEEI